MSAHRSARWLIAGMVGGMAALAAIVGAASGEWGVALRLLMPIGLVAEALIFGVTLGLMSVLHRRYREAFREVARRRAGVFRQTILLEPVIEVPTDAGLLTVDLRTDADSYNDARRGGYRRWTRFHLPLADTQPARSLDVTLTPDREPEGWDVGEGEDDARLALAALASLSSRGARVRVSAETTPPEAEVLTRGWIGDTERLDATLEEASRELARLAAGLTSHG